MAQTYPLTKVALAGALATDTIVRRSAQALFLAGKTDDTMLLLRQLGLPEAIKLGDIKITLEKAFAAATIYLDYDENNCKYGALIQAAAKLDAESDNIG